MSNHLLTNGQLASVQAGQWNNDSVTFAGTTSIAGQEPSVTFTGSNTLSNVAISASGATHDYGAINVAAGSALATAALSVIDATLSVNERPGSSVTFNGISTISNGSTLTATGYSGAGSYSVNGTMNIDGSSTVNMDYVAVAGTGTFHLAGANALLRAGHVAAGDTVKLDGGMLSLTNGMTFLGTVTDSSPSTSRIASGASVAVYNALDAVRESFDLTTGALDLYNVHGTEVASIKFAGHGVLYAAATTGLATNYIEISSHSLAGALPTSFMG